MLYKVSRKAIFPEVFVLSLMGTNLLYEFLFCYKTSGCKVRIRDPGTTVSSPLRTPQAVKNVLSPLRTRGMTQVPLL